MKLRNKLSLIVALLASMLAPQAHAYDWYVASTVAYVEATYMPGAIVFTINDAAGSCPAGSTLHWNPSSADNAKAIFAALLGARASGTQIRMFGVNSGCVVSNLLFG